MDQFLRELQKMSLQEKIERSADRIKRWVSYNHHDRKMDGGYIAFSGGKDSAVLLDLVRQVDSDVMAVFVDTGLEYPEIRQFVKTIKNVVWVKPQLTFRQVLDNYGYPVISKAQAMAIRKITTQNLSEKYRNKLLYGDEKGTAGKLSDKWHYLLNAPFKISEQCCDIMKKKPFLDFERGIKKEYDAIVQPLTGEMAVESRNREIVWLNNGCNAFDTKHPKSTPLAFWTEQDILQYIKKYKVPYSSIYGEIEEYENGLKFTGEQRTGCMFCMFGCHMESCPNRFQRMAKTHPKQYDYCINKLGLGEILDYIKVPYRVFENYYSEKAMIGTEECEQLKIVI